MSFAGAYPEDCLIRATLPSHVASPNYLHIRPSLGFPNQHTSLVPYGIFDLFPSVYPDPGHNIIKI